MALKFVLRRPLFYAAIAAACLIAVVRFAFPQVYYAVPPDDVSRLASETESRAALEGRVVSEPEERQGFYGELSSSFVLAAEKAGEGSGARRVSGLVRVTVREPRLAFGRGDRLRLEGDLELPLARRNPGGFDFRDYLDRRGVRAQLYVSKKDEYAVLEKGRFVFWIDGPARFRAFLSRGLSDGFGEDDAAFLKALLLGEKRDVDADFQDLFVRTGTLHLLAVSGFNVGFLCAVLLFLLAPFRFPKNLRLSILVLAIWIYCLVVGWQAPLVRASVMATVFLLGKMLGRRSDLLNSMGLSALVILAASPKALFDAGFQLSFAAVLGLALFMPAFTRECERIPGERPPFSERALIYAEELFWVSFVASFATLPITVQNFYVVTPSALAANMIVVPLSFLLFFCGVIYFFTFSWAPPALSFLPGAMKLLMTVFTRSLEWIAAWPGACVAVGRLDWVLWSVLTAGTLFLLWDPRFKSRLARAAALLLLAANVFLVQEAGRAAHRRFEMTALDVGQGDSIYFEFPGGGNLLVDAGRGDSPDEGRRVVVPFLRSRGVRDLDALVISHPQADHIGGMASVLKEVRVRNVIDAKKHYESALYRRLQGLIGRERGCYLKAAAGDRIEGFSGVSIEVLNPPREGLSKNINDDSVILRVVYGRTSFLLTGDIESPAIRRLMAGGFDVRADVLKVPHHGAKTDAFEADFFQAVSPKYSVISAGRHNPFKHPRPETLDALAAVEGNAVLRTDREGFVQIVSDGNSLKVNR